jgi:hypothetical protein
LHKIAINIHIKIDRQMDRYIRYEIPSPYYPSSTSSLAKSSSSIQTDKKST